MGTEAAQKGRRRPRFPFSINGSERADWLISGILKGEAAGVLAWAITGCLTWQRGGLNPPGGILDATAEYLDGQDRIGSWLSERCEPCSPEPKESAGVRELYGDYREWMHGVGETPKSEMEFSAWLGRRYVKKHTETGAKLLGIRLRGEEAGADLLLPT